MPVRPEPVGVKIGAFIRRWILLVQRIPGTRITLSLIDHRLREPVCPQPLTGLAAKRIIAVDRFHWQGKDGPLISLLFEEPTAQVVKMPARLDYDDRAGRLQPRQRVVDKPLPGNFTGARTLGVFLTADRIINYK